MKTIGLCVRQIRNYGMFTAYIRVGAFNKLPCLQLPDCYYVIQDAF